MPNPRCPQSCRGIRRDHDEPDQLAEALRYCRDNGILSIITYIFGLPGETEQTIEANIRWALRHEPNLVDFHPLFILPHSEMSRQYPEGRVCAFSDEEFETHCASAMRRFYLRPSPSLRLLRFILRHNPGFFLRAPYVAKRAVHSLSVFDDVAAARKRR